MTNEEKETRKYKVLHCMHNGEFHDSYVLDKQIMTERELRQYLGFIQWLKNKKKLQNGTKVRVEQDTFMYIHTNFDIIQLYEMK